MSDKSLSDFLREIGDEQITITIDGYPYTCTRQEALARKMYVLAYGGVVEEQAEDGQMIKIYYKPDYRVAKMIREYTEGKPNTELPPEKQGNAKAGSFDSSISKRLNEKLGLKRPVVKGKP